MDREGGIQGGLAGGVDGLDLAVMHLVGYHQTQAGVMMRRVVPVEEFPAELLGILDAAGAFQKRTASLLSPRPRPAAIVPPHEHQHANPLETRHDRPLRR